MKRGEMIIKKRESEDLLKSDKNWNIGSLPEPMEEKRAYAYYNKKLQKHWERKGLKNEQC